MIGIWMQKFLLWVPPGGLALHHRNLMPGCSRGGPRVFHGIKNFPAMLCCIDSYPIRILVRLSF
eukprot:4135025-Ditylum_brightwellii.AAC.1